MLITLYCCPVANARRCDLLHVLVWVGTLSCFPADRTPIFPTGDTAMLAKTSIALAILLALSSGALAAHKRHDGAASAYARAPSIDERYGHSPSIEGRYSRWRSIDELCR